MTTERGYGSAIFEHPFDFIDEYTVLSAALRAIASTSDLQALAQALAGWLALIMPLEALGIIALNGHAEQAESVFLPGYSPALDASLTRMIARHGARPGGDGGETRADETSDGALLAAPIPVDDRLLGAIAVRAGKGGTYTSRDNALIEQIALALGLALRARQLEAANRRRNRQLEAIERLAGRLNRLPGPHQIAEALASEVGAVATHAGCRVYIKEGDEFCLAAHAGIEPGMDHDLDAGSVAALWTRCARAEIHRSSGGGTRLVVPLYHENACMGLLLLERPDSNFDPDDVHLVESLAAQAATAISDAIAHRELQRRVRELENLQRAVAIVGSNLDRTTTLERIATALAGVAGYRMIGLYMRDGDELALQAQIGYQSSITRLPMGRGVMARCVREGRPILLEDVRTDPDYIAALTDIRSEVAVPVFLDGTAVGVLNVESGPERKLGAWDLALVELFSQQVSVALANVSRFERAVERATVDWVSRLPNHGALMERLAEAVHEADERRTPLSLLFIDLDHFKSINDLYGHRFGDSVLASMGRLLTRWVPEHAYPARYGGEEFAVLLPDTDEAGALRVAASIQSALAEHELTTPAGTILRLTVSIGTATRETDRRCIQTPEDLLESADRAMYAAKYGGRNRTVPWSAELDEPEAIAS